MIRILPLACAGILLFSSCATAPAATKSGGGKNAGKSAAQEIALPTSTEPSIAGKAASGDIAGAIDEYEAAVLALPADYAALSATVVETLGRLRDRIVGAVSALAVEPAVTPDPTVTGKPFKKPFAVKVSRVSSDDVSAGIGVSGVPLRILAPAFPADGSATGSAAGSVLEATTGDDGTASFAPDAPPRSAEASVRFSLAYTSSDPALNAALEAAQTGKFAELPYLAGTLNKSIPTSISFLDFDQNGKAMGGMGVTSTACLKPLVKLGFTRIGMADFQSQLASGDDKTVITAAKKLFGSAVDRLIYGTTRVVSVSQGDDGLWNATVEANASVWNFKADEKAWSGSCAASAQGKTAAAAVAAARDAVAAGILPLKLYYNL